MNCLDEYKHMTADERRDVHVEKCGPIPTRIALFNVCGGQNVGQILRTAALTGVDKVWLFGRRVYDARFSVGAQNYLTIVNPSSNINPLHVMIDTQHPIECGCGECKVYNITAFSNFLDENPDVYPIVFECGGMSIRSEEFCSRIKNALSENRKPLLILGNEAHGVPKEICECVVERGGIVASIPQFGIMRSHNVAIACAIGLWKLLELKD
jgi:tRNA G18 (ribose-2'-O)-methylase SpoU